MTALAANAMLCEGSTANRGRYGDNIRKATRYLLSIAQKDGLIGFKENKRYTYGHGYSMIFLAGLYGQEEDADQRAQLTRVLTKAVEFTVKAQIKNGGWGYVSGKEGNHFDEGTTVVPQIQGLRACQATGIPVPRSSISRAIQYVGNCQMRDGGIRYSITNRGASRGPLSAGALVSLISASDVSSTGAKKGTAGKALPKLKVLLIASGPTRDYRYVSRMLFRHPDVRVEAWLQSVEPKTIERVILDVDLLLKDLPKSLSTYDVVIGFDPDWQRMTAAQRKAFPIGLSRTAAA